MNDRTAAVRRLVSTALLTVGLTSVLAAFAAAQNTNSNANTGASPSPTPSPIPVSSIVSEADKVDTRIGEIRNFIDSRPDNFEIVSGIAGMARQIDELSGQVSRALAGSATLEELNTLEATVQSSSRKVNGWSSTLQTQATALDSRVAEVRDLVSLWRRSIESYAAETSAANTTANISPGEILPPEALRRANETVFKLGEFLKDVERRRAEVIDLQAKVSGIDTRLNNILSSIKERRSAELSRLFVRNGPPVWAADEWRSPSAALDGFGRSFSQRWSELRLYVINNAARFAVHFVLIILIALGLAWAGRKVVPMVEAEPKLERPSTIFRYPLVGGMLLSVLFWTILYPNSPRLLQTVLGLAVLIPAVYLLRKLIDRPLHVILYGLVVFYFFDRIREISTADEFWPRALFLFEMLAAALLLLWFFSSRRLAAKVEAGDQRLFRNVRNGVPFAVAVFAVAFVAGTAGFTNLAGLLGNGVLRSAYAALILYAFYEVLKGVVIFLLRVRPLSALGMVRNKRALIRVRTMQFLGVILVILWLLVALNAFSVRDAVFGFLSDILSASYAIGSLTFSVGHVVGFIVAVWLAFLLSRFLRFILEEDVYPRVGLSGGVSYAVSTMVHYAVLILGFLLAIAALGFELTQFAFIAGAVGIGVGFGLQNIINNFVSGLILLFERPVKVGDTVQIAEHIGSLTQIGLRASVLRKVDGSDVIVPNSYLISEEVINWTMSDDKRRLDIPVGVAYGTDPKAVLDLLVKVAVANPDIMNEPAPRALFVGFGESSLDFELRAWTDNSENWVPIRSDLVTAVNAALTEAKIEIPFPQRDLHVRSVDGSVFAANRKLNKDGE